jgi:hypothetical protein
MQGVALPSLGMRMSDAVLHSRRIEFVCDVCLHSAYALDTAKPPHCPHAHGAMTPDSEEPLTCYKRSPVVRRTAGG